MKGQRCCTILYIFFETLIIPIYKGPWSTLSITKKDSAHKSNEKEVASEFLFSAQKYYEISPQKKLFFGSLQTILLCIGVGELEGGRVNGCGCWH